MNIKKFKGDEFLIRFDFENRIEHFYSARYYYVNNSIFGDYDLRDITSDFTEEEMEQINKQKDTETYYYDSKGNLITQYPTDISYTFNIKEKETGKLKKIFRFIEYEPFCEGLYSMKKEQFGLYLIRFLNTDFSNFESAFNGFFKYYGFSIFAFKGETSMLNKEEYVGEEFLSEISKIYNYNKEDLIYIQKKYKEIVYYIYFDEKYKKYSNYYKLYAYTLFYDLSEYVLKPVNLSIFSDEENNIFFDPGDEIIRLLSTSTFIFFRKM